MESTFIILTQIITFGTAWSMFHCVLKRKKKRLVFTGGGIGVSVAAFIMYMW